MDLAIPFQIFGRIFEFDAVLLEKFVNFQTGFKTKKPTQIGWLRAYIHDMPRGRSPPERHEADLCRGRLTLSTIPQEDQETGVALN